MRGVSATAGQRRVICIPVRTRKLDQRRGWPFVLGGAVILEPLFLLTTKPVWTDGLKIHNAVDLSDLADLPHTAVMLATTTERIMSAITGIVEELRGESAPAVRLDMKKAGVGDDYQQREAG